MRVVISNGFGQFHLRGLAEQLEAAEELDLYLSGALPPALLDRVPSAFTTGPLRRLSERRLAVGRGRARDMKSAEIAHQLSQRLRSIGRTSAADHFSELSMRLYSRRADRALKTGTRTGQIYHVRAGFGGESIATAKRQGMRVCVDHSIVAPAVLDRYVPDSPLTRLMPQMWRRVQRDIDAADVVLVNSDFVAQTFAEAGYGLAEVRVAYTPVDPGFGALVDTFQRPRRGKPVVTFAGTAEYRKGIDVVSDLAAAVGPEAAEWRVIGGWMPDAAKWRDSMPIFVSVEPKKSRTDLARVLAETDVFVFPSRAEGSARVVAEALRAGCQVVTTRMSGSAARHGQDGYVFDSLDDLTPFISGLKELLAQSPESRTASMHSTRDYAVERLSSPRYLSDVRAAYLSGSQG